MAPPWMQKLGGLFSEPQITGGVFGENAVPGPDPRMAFATELLSQSGYAPYRRPFGEILGQAMQQAQKARALGVDRQRQAELQKAQMGLINAQAAKAGGPGDLIGSASPSDFTPASLAKYQQTRNPSDLVPVEKNMFGRFQPRDYTPESLDVFTRTQNPGDLRRVANYQPVAMAGGGTGSYNPVTGGMDAMPVSNEDAQAQAAELARRKAEATAAGEASGKAQGAILTRALNAGGIQDILDIAEPLIDEATGSGTGAIRDKLAAFFGYSTTGAQATAQLLPLQAAIMLRQPRMEGPQSDADVQLYREAAGQIGDPSVPGPTKKAAMKTIGALNEKYQDNPTGAPKTAPKRVKVDANGDVIGN